MATRPVFITSYTKPYFIQKDIEFQYFKGFADTQKKKSIRSLHEEFIKLTPNHKILEISSKSEDELGVKLSAFNLLIKTKTDKQYSVEVAFQSSKVFEKGGPYKDLLTKTSKEAKADPRLKNSGRLKLFEFGNRTFELSPTTYFYNWLYINALDLNKELSEQLIEYDAFTDIVFNPEKSINCQARAAAVYVSLRKSGLLEKALEDKDTFLSIVYGDEQTKNLDVAEQMSMWEKL